MKTIQELRAGKGWSQADLADEMNVTQATISNWERGRSEPSIAKFGLLARQFGVSIGEIVLPQYLRRPPSESTATSGEVIHDSQFGRHLHR